jgi:hypothetical protein
MASRNKPGRWLLALAAGALGLMLTACSSAMRTDKEDLLAEIVARKPSGQGVAPVLDFIGFRQTVERYTVVYPEFHFHSSDGNVVAIHRELVATNRLAGSPAINQNGFVSIPADQQRKGAVYVGGWHCGPEAYAATLKAFLVDTNGNHSNALEYTVHCNGG